MCSQPWIRHALLAIASVGAAVRAQQTMPEFPPPPHQILLLGTFHFAAPDKWQIVDLRPLRGYVHDGSLSVKGAARETIFGFDLLLLMGGTDEGRTTWKQ